MTGMDSFSKAEVFSGVPDSGVDINGSCELVAVDREGSSSATMAREELVDSSGTISSSQV